MIFIEIIQYGLGILMMILVSHQLMLSISTLKEKKQISFNSARNRHFAIVIPSPKNEQLISKSLYSVFGLIYPKNLYDVIVIADNISEDVANNAREMGAIVLKQNSSSRVKKNHELQWVFEWILQGNELYDAILVIESDSLVSGNYLDVMNYYLDNENTVIQSSNLILPQAGLQGNEVRQFSFLLYNLVKPMDQKVLGFNMGLRGNGICFTTQTLRENPWIPDSLADDAGFGLLLQLKGIKVGFAHEAILLTEMSPKSKNSNFKQKRWNSRISVIKRYVPKLVKAIFQHKSLSYFKNLLNLIIPSLINMFIVAVIMVGLNLVMWATADWSLSFVWIWMCTAVLGIMTIGVELYSLITYHESYKSAF